MSPQKISVLNAAENYFSSINPIASRIYADFEETKSSYECVWNTLSTEEQSQILNECIIKPEVTLQYSLKTSAFNKQNDNNDAFGNKRIVDENVSYRDEHSAPFSFKTLSQVDLRLFANNTRSNVSVTPKIETPKTQEQLVPPAVSATPSSSCSGELQQFPRPATSCSSGSGSSGGGGGGPHSDRRPLLASPQGSDQHPDHMMPRTGLDFLDNW